MLLIELKDHMLKLHVTHVHGFAAVSPRCDIKDDRGQGRSLGCPAGITPRITIFKVCVRF